MRKITTTTNFLRDFRIPKLLRMRIEEAIKLKHRLDQPVSTKLGAGVTATDLEFRQDYERDLTDAVRDLAAGLGYDIVVCGRLKNER